MKKLILVSALGAIMTASAGAAVKKCVALSTSSTCTGSLYPPSAVTDWFATCDDSTVVKGIGICGTSNNGTNTTYITLDDSDNNNNICFCRMITPAVSTYWIWTKSFSDQATCLNDCAATCMRDFNNGSTGITRQGFLSSLTD